MHLGANGQRLGKQTGYTAPVARHTSNKAGRADTVAAQRKGQGEGTLALSLTTHKAAIAESNANYRARNASSGC